MDISKIDLNLLVVLHHLLLKKRVSTVAEVLGMSQPAVSSALGRLRSTLGECLAIGRTRGHGFGWFATSLECAGGI